MSNCSYRIVEIEELADISAIKDVSGKKSVWKILILILRCNKLVHIENQMFRIFLRSTFWQ